MTTTFEGTDEQRAIVKQVLNRYRTSNCDDSFLADIIVHHLTVRLPHTVVSPKQTVTAVWSQPTGQEDHG